MTVIVDDGMVEQMDPELKYTRKCSAMRCPDLATHEYGKGRTHRFLCLRHAATWGLGYRFGKDPSRERLLT